MVVERQFRTHEFGDSVLIERPERTILEGSVSGNWADPIAT
jgi:hypothetical protein